MAIRSRPRRPLRSPRGHQDILFGLAILSVLSLAIPGLPVSSAWAQEGKDQVRDEKEGPQDTKSELAPGVTKVGVTPVRDEQIAGRLRRILDATGWFKQPQVRVEEGVVFLAGEASSESLKKWAGELARSTQDVVAVANQMEVPEPSVWDFRPAWNGLLALWQEFIRALPLLGLGIIVLGLSLAAGVFTTRGLRAILHRRIRVKLLRNVVACGGGTVVFLCGVYVILRVAGLTQLALTIVGGTGLVGLAVGFAFRDITENFLASIFLSIQRPFESGDLVEVSGITGYVQKLNMRTTILMTLDGNLVQIPNAVVYKSNLRNFTTNANRREDFVVGIGYPDAVCRAQEVARNVLAEHPAVLKDPEPSVLADSLGKATVNLRVYFWLNGREHSWLKVRSSVIRLVKAAFQKEGISMPDEAREVLFPRGIPVTLLKGDHGRPPAPNGGQASQAKDQESEAVSTKAEAGLYSDAEVIGQQARKVPPLNEEADLLSDDSPQPGPKG